MRSWLLTLAGTVVVLTAATVLPPLADEGSDEPSVVIERWLVLGPAPSALPVFHDADHGDYDLEDLLDDEALDPDRLEPVSGEKIQWFGAGDLVWTEGVADTDGNILLGGQNAEAGHPELAWLAVYLHVDRWSELELELPGAHPRRIWLDGDHVGGGGFSDESDEVEEEIELTPGRHLLLVQTARDPERDEPWTIGGWLQDEEGGRAVDARQSTDPARSVELRDILDPPQVSSLDVSPDGKRIALSFTRIVPGSHETEVWIEIRTTEDGSILESWRDGEGAGQLAFSPDGRWLAYLSDVDGDEATILVRDTVGGRTIPFLDDEEGLLSFAWAPDGKAIFFVTVNEADDDDGVKRVTGLMDRWSTHRDKHYLNMITVPGGTRRRLTAGPTTTELMDVSPDGKRLLFSRTLEDLSERPYSRTELWELELATLEGKLLRECRWLDGALWGPDGRRILVMGEPREFGNKGKDVPKKTTANSYDAQLFIWDPRTDEVEAITRDFDPAIRSYQWSRHDGRIYVRTYDRDSGRLYRYDPGEREFVPLDSGFETLSGWAIAHDAPVIVVAASSAWVPQGLAAIDLTTGKSRRLEHPADSWFAHVERGAIESWSFEASSGRTIDGRVYLPPDFDPAERYPVVVFYYGGALPIQREFGGRYPLEWWASAGYVVYVLQPSGAVGYGQASSALHVNDWGKTTSDEIIEGTRAFLASHEYADPERVGAIGASYGGFMTMLLVTRTDLFSAAVSHAGISSIASYWGEGWWGYSYSSVAGAESFPWNRPDLYVDQSPLFRADQARVPILLTHGTRDTNVPLGESDQFFAALKLLGKTVEYVQFAGQDHWILDHEKRGIWSSTILAWFDRWLKDQPEWWNDLYPEDE